MCYLYSCSLVSKHSQWIFTKWNNTCMCMCTSFFEGSDLILYIFLSFFQPEYWINMHNKSNYRFYLVLSYKWDYKQISQAFWHINSNTWIFFFHVFYLNHSFALLIIHFKTISFSQLQEWLSVIFQQNDSIFFNLPFQVFILPFSFINSLMTTLWNCFCLS